MRAMDARGSILMAASLLLAMGALIAAFPWLHARFAILAAGFSAVTVGWLLLDSERALPARQRVTDCLRTGYDGESIMASMGSLGHYMQDLSRAGFEVRDFLHEGNGDIWLAALEHPHPYVGWILIEEKAEGGDILARRARRNPQFLDQLQARVPKTEAPVMFLCRSGARSHQAAVVATQAGYPNSYNILEGFEGDKDAQGHRNSVGGWRVAGLPWAQG